MTARRDPPPDRIGARLAVLYLVMAAKAGPVDPVILGRAVVAIHHNYRPADPLRLEMDAFAIVYPVIHDKPDLLTRAADRLFGAIKTSCAWSAPHRPGLRGRSADLVLIDEWHIKPKEGPA